MASDFVPSGRPEREPSELAPLSRRLASELADFRLSLGSHLVLHSLAVGAAVGVVACVFYGVLRLADAWIVGGLMGYESIHPAGEVTLHVGRRVHRFSPLLILLVPALGGLAAGLLAAKAAPEISGGGGDAYVEAFHRRDGVIRKRVAWLKMLATTFTLGSGGSAGREGPTMQVGAAIAALLCRRFDLGPKEQRLLLVAGTAAGLAAMFGTPLGAALLATEVLYRDDFESDALVPSILASVVAYSIFSTAFPSTGHLFAHAHAYPFVPSHLMAYACLALIVAVAGRSFEAMLHGAGRAFARVRRSWIRPAVGGLALGAIATTWLTWVAPRLGLHGVDVGILGAGSGAAQAAIVPARWIPAGWGGVAFFAGFAVLKMVTTSLTLGSGGSAGDFGPSLAIGGMIGGAFGRAMQIAFDPSIDPGAFALVGMGAFYGGLANVPVSALVLVCELAGNYDLLVPLMLCNVLAYVLLRRANLYRSQPTSRFESPTHADGRALDALRGIRVASILPPLEPLVMIDATAALPSVVKAIASAPDSQDTFPVVDADARLIGLIDGNEILHRSDDRADEAVPSAIDLARPLVTAAPTDDLHVALRRILSSGLREIPVVDSRGALLGMLDEAMILSAFATRAVG